MAYILTIEQRISAGSDWNASLPSTTPVDGDNGIRVYPADTQGGRFDFSNFTSIYLWQIYRITINFNGVATKSVVIRNDSAGAQDFYVWESTNPAEDRITITDRFRMAPDEYLAISSTGATTAMSARILGIPLHSSHKI